jgi:nitrile hydratase accessory protein
VSTSALQSRRAEIDTLVCGLPAVREGDKAFDEPWQIRAFALAIGAHEAGEFEWTVFQSALIDSIKDWEERNDSDADFSYYEHWVRALEVVLSGAGKLDSDILDSKTQEVLATPANRGHHEARLDPIAIDPGTRA